MARQRLTVQQAAEALGVSTDAVRKRARRGTLDSEKAEDGYLYVWLDTGTPPGAPNGSTPTQAHLDSLEDQIAFLRAELERKDTLLMTLMHRIPELEAPHVDGGGSVGVDDHPTNSGPHKRSWWARLFGE